MLQTKEQNKTPEEELSEGEMGNLPKKEFRVMTIKMIEEIGRRMEAQSDKLEVFHKELEKRTSLNRNLSVITERSWDG